MMATTFEAIIGAVFEDSGANNHNAVCEVMDDLGFFDHSLFPVTYCDPPPFCFTDKQITIDVQSLDLG